MDVTCCGMFTKNWFPWNQTNSPQHERNLMLALLATFFAACIGRCVFSEKQNILASLNDGAFKSHLTEAERVVSLLLDHAPF